MADVIGIRDDMYIGKGNTYMKEAAALVFNRYRDSLYVEAGYKSCIIAAMIFPAKCKNPADILLELATSGK